MYDLVPATARIGFLGPVGTFTEQALRTQPDLAAAELVPMDSFAEILYAVESGSLDFGFVAVENAIEGTVNVTMDTLAFDVELHIQREVVLPVEMNLLVRPGVTLGEVTSVLSFPHAHAQCRDWLRTNVPTATFEAAVSTAEAARLVAQRGDSGLGAISNRLAAEVYGLEVLATDIEDHEENATRFMLVGPRGIPAPTGRDKTSIVVFQRADAPGSLLSILQEFAARRINLSLLLSRPTKQSLGDYCFILEFAGHVADPVITDCLRALKQSHEVRFLGSYPRAEFGDTVSKSSVMQESEQVEKWIRELHDAVRSPDSLT